MRLNMFLFKKNQLQMAITMIKFTCFDKYKKMLEYYDKGKISSI